MRYPLTPRVYSEPSLFIAQNLSAVTWVWLSMPLAYLLQRTYRCRISSLKSAGAILTTFIHGFTPTDSIEGCGMCAVHTMQNMAAIEAQGTLQRRELSLR